MVMIMMDKLIVSQWFILLWMRGTSFSWSLYRKMNHHSFNWHSHASYNSHGTYMEIGIKKVAMNSEKEKKFCIWSWTFLYFIFLLIIIILLPSYTNNNNKNYLPTLSSYLLPSIREFSFPFRIYFFFLFFSISSLIEHQNYLVFFSSTRSPCIQPPSFQPW